jgi:phospholipase C
LDPTKIKHIFVLMLENRSFDHLLGYANLPGTDGLSGKTFSNLDSTHEPVPTTPNSEYAGDLDPDPGHDFDDVTLQLYGTDTPSLGQQPDMSGFVASYAEKCNGDVPSSRRIMKCFDPSKLSVLVSLAQNYAVCDNWFSSVPGPTLPNRLFVHCGTSGGRLDLSPEYFSGFKTIYEVLDRASVPGTYPKGVPSTIYSDGWTAAATFPYLLKYQDQFFGTLDDFYSDCARDEQDVPAYCFIEPRYGSGLVGATFSPENDQHPDSDVRQGEKLIYRIYQAILKNKKLWESSVLLITYDEHGGTYDHIPPPLTVAPDNRTSQNPQFDFRRLGVRVPSVIVSPYIESGTVSKIQFDHTSIISTVRKLFTNVWQDETLGSRAAQARTFDDPTIFSRDTPRQDTIDISPLPPPASSSAPKPINDLQREHVQQAAYIEQSLPPDKRTGIDPGAITTDQQADAYVARVFAAARATAGGTS